MEPERRPSTREFPGGSDLNNKEAILAGLTEEEQASFRPEPIVLAQTFAGPRTATVPSEQAGDAGEVVGNRRIPSGTFMTESAAGLRVPAAPAPGRPNGAIVGTRAEPVVPAATIP